MDCAHLCLVIKQSIRTLATRVRNTFFTLNICNFNFNETNEIQNEIWFDFLKVFIIFV